jgi:ATP-dependent DNA helicase RecQ
MLNAVSDPRLVAYVRPGDRSVGPQLEAAQQLRNVWGAFRIDGQVPSGPALLVDDISDSRWTLTVVGRHLRLAGCTCGYPFVLAKAVSG